MYQDYLKFILRNIPLVLTEKLTYEENDNNVKLQVGAGKTEEFTRSLDTLSIRYLEKDNYITISKAALLDRFKKIDAQTIKHRIDAIEQKICSLFEIYSSERLAQITTNTTDSVVTNIFITRDATSQKSIEIKYNLNPANFSMKITLTGMSQNKKLLDTIFDIGFSMPPYILMEDESYKDDAFLLTGFNKLLNTFEKINAISQEELYSDKEKSKAHNGKLFHLNRVPHIFRLFSINQKKPAISSDKPEYKSTTHCR